MASASPAAHQHRPDRKARSGWTGDKAGTGPESDWRGPPSRGFGDLPVATLFAMKQAASIHWAVTVVAVVAQPTAAGEVATATAALCGATVDRHVIERALTIAARAGWITRHPEAAGGARYSATRAGLALLGEMHSSSRQADHSMNPVQATSRALPPISLDDDPRLTAQQRRVAALVASGLTSREVAAQLGCRRRTVDNHVAHILTKLGLANRHELARGVAAHPHLRELMHLESPSAVASPTAHKGACRTAGRIADEGVGG